MVDGVPVSILVAKIAKYSSFSTSQLMLLKPNMRMYVAKQTDHAMEILTEARQEYDDDDKGVDNSALALLREAVEYWNRRRGGPLAATKNKKPAAATKKKTAPKKAAAKKKKTPARKPVAKNKIAKKPVAKKKNAKAKKKSGCSNWDR